ncbi:collagen alpha-1(I) chain-like [Neopelma chrysocephalum]|uniref:collagen alpha-1(I) chain-like n=1 Tax=Neopelma chrysocephalum TaxID=114329 RepID=UPI000FCD2112|nr:collagen alpha-1(I) chain-like [Neopelma chrysocephalum]
MRLTQPHLPAASFEFSVYLQGTSPCFGLILRVEQGTQPVPILPFPDEAGGRSTGLTNSGRTRGGAAAPNALHQISAGLRDEPPGLRSSPVGPAPAHTLAGSRRCGERGGTPAVCGTERRVTRGGRGRLGTRAGWRRAFSAAACGPGGWTLHLAALRSPDLPRSPAERRSIGARKNAHDRSARGAPGHGAAGTADSCRGSAPPQGPAGAPLADSLPVARGAPHTPQNRALPRPALQPAAPTEPPAAPAARCLPVARPLPPAAVVRGSPTTWPRWLGSPGGAAPAQEEPPPATHGGN